MDRRTAMLIDNMVPMTFTIESPQAISPNTPVAAVSGTYQGQSVVFLAIRQDANLLHEGTINGVPCHMLLFTDDVAPWELGHQLIEAFEKLKRERKSS